MFDADGGRGFGTKPRLMNATKLAEYLGVSTATVRRLVRGGKLPKPPPARHQSRHVGHHCN